MPPRSHRAPRRRASPSACRSPRSRRRRPAPSPGVAPNSGASARRSALPPATTTVAPASCRHAQSSSPIGPGPSTATVCPALDRPLDACSAHASGSTSAATSDASRARDRVEVDARDPLRHDEQLRVRAVQERQQVLAERLPPRAHCAHVPHGAEFAATTRLPVATSKPQNSWPNGDGSSESSSGWPRRNVFRSVPSVSATSICTSTSPAPGCGIGDVLDAQVAGRRRSAPLSRREHDLERSPAREELEPFGEALERQHRSARARRARAGARRPRASRPASPSASRRRSARAGRRRPRAASPASAKTSTVPPGATASSARRTGAARADDRRVDRPVGRAPARARDRASTANTSSPRRSSTAPNSRPTKPLPTTSTRPRGTRSAPRSTHASGSTIVARASSSESGSSTPSAARDALGEAAGDDRRRRELRRTSTRARRGSARTRRRAGDARARRAPSARAHDDLVAEHGARRAPAPSFSTSEPQSPHASTSHGVVRLVDLGELRPAVRV